MYNSYNSKWVVLIRELSRKKTNLGIAIISIFRLILIWRIRIKVFQGKKLIIMLKLIIRIKEILTQGIMINPKKLKKRLIKPKMRSKKMLIRLSSIGKSSWIKLLNIIKKLQKKEKFLEMAKDQKVLIENWLREKMLNQLTI